MHIFENYTDWKNGLLKFANNKFNKLIFVLITYGSLLILLWFLFPEEYYVDWVYAFRPAVWEMLSGHTPYTIPGVYNPPWTFILLIPLALIPPKLGAILLTFITFFSLLFIALRLGGNTYIALSFLLIPQIAFKTITNPNIDFLAAFGFILPPQIGLFFLAIKPQIGIAVAFFWLIEAWRKGGSKEVIRVFAPVSIALFISFLLFGPYMLKAVHLIDRDTTWYSYPLWPYTLPVGLAILLLAIKREEKKFSITASPFVSPYVASYTYPFALLGLVNNRLYYLSAYIGFWMIYIIERFF